MHDFLEPRPRGLCSLTVSDIPVALTSERKAEFYRFQINSPETFMYRENTFVYIVSY